MGNALVRFNHLVFCLLCVQHIECLRGAPAGLSALLSQTALSKLLQSDLSPLHCSQDAEAEDEEQVVCKSGGRYEASLLLLMETPAGHSLNYPLCFCPPPPSVLESVAVQRVFLNELITVALAWHRSFPELPPPPSHFLQCCVHAIKNTRRKMEDKHVTLTEFNQLFGIKVQDHIQPVTTLFFFLVIHSVPKV